MSETVKLRVLKKEEIQTSVELNSEDVFCPEFGEDAVIRLREMTSDDSVALAAKVSRSKQAEEGAMLTWIIASAVNEDGSPLFEEADRAWLGKKGMKFIMRIGRAALRLNGVDKDGAEDREKN